MHRLLVGLTATCAFAGAASAQSSVTVYGSIDVGMTKGNGGTAPNSGANGTSTNVTQKQARASRLGFRGNEDLGGGLSVQFHLEHRFTPNTGAAATPFFAGRSYVQISSVDLGRIYMGREFAPAVWAAVTGDPFGFDGLATISGEQYAGFTSSSINAHRTANAIGYRSPKWGGFSGVLAFSRGEDLEPNTSSAYVEYADGPFYAGIAYQKGSGGPLPLLVGTSVFNTTLSYDLGWVKPILHYAKSQTSGGALHHSFFSVGAIAPVGSGLVRAVVGKVTPDDANTTANRGLGAGNGTQTKFGFGYEHFLSKRTSLYADLSHARKTGTVGNQPNGPRFSSNTAYALGVRHAF